jgi:hypothetical protein
MTALALRPCGMTVIPFRVCLNRFRVYSVPFRGYSFVTVRTPDGRCHSDEDEPRTAMTRRADTRRSEFRVARPLGGFRDCASLRAE